MKDIKISSLEKLLRDFYNLTDIKACIYDLNGNELCYYPEKLSTFCEVLRKNKEMDERCRGCDKYAFANCRKNHSQYAYTCHAGLKECVSPIVRNDQIIGFIMIGQIKNPDSPDFSSIAKNIPQEATAQLRDCYAQLPIISSEKLSSAFRILDACASYEMLKVLVPPKTNSIDAQIEQYVHDNLPRRISVAQMCKDLRLSHCEIYNIFKEYFDCTPAEYVKRYKLKHACHLLTATALPVNKIAMKCGIPDYNYFSKIFKSEFGTSPTDYRKSNR